MSIVALSPAEGQSSDFSVNSNTLQERLVQELLNLRKERQQLLAQLNNVGGTQESDHHLVASVKGAPDLKEFFPEQANSSLELPTKIFEMYQSIQILERRISAMEEKRLTFHGRTTAHRIKRLEDLLKSYGGSQAFKQLQSDLGLSPSQFTRLVKYLNRRRFEVQKCPGAQRGEKMLILK